MSWGIERLPEEERKLWEKPERYGDGDQIFIRQHRVNVTSDLKTVGGHALMTESYVFIPGMGEMHWLVDATGKEPEGLEVLDHTTPIGSPWVSETPT